MHLTGLVKGWLQISGVYLVNFAESTCGDTSADQQVGIIAYDSRCHVNRIDAVEGAGSD